MARTTKASAEPGAPKAPKPPPVPKFWRDIAAYQAGASDLAPGRDSPVCAKCGLDIAGCAKSPYLPSAGSEAPVVTVVFESVSQREDRAQALACEGSRNGLVKQHLEKIAREVGLDPRDIRYVAMTRCANTTEKKIDYKPRGNWCRAHLVRDLQRHPPRVIIPVGTAVLGRLSHKSNAQDWSGRMLTYRAWPDDWLTQKKYDEGSAFTGPRPGSGAARALMVPIQAPYIVYGTQNPNDVERWKKHMRRGLEMGVHGAAAPSYDRPWFRIAETADEVVAGLREIPDGVRVAYDLETTGLLAFAEDAGIVFAMFRWVDPASGQPRALGFPWLYEGSPITRDDAVKIMPEWKRVLYRTKLVGHNVTFDLIYTFARLPEIDLVQMTASLDADTRMMLYALRQSKESLGLELIAYDWCPDMAGYEEEFELLKRREPELLDPAEGKGGHYANVPRDLWPTHLKPYVMGDVEVAYMACEGIEEKLENARRYNIPLADPDRLGTFREFKPPGRAFMYRKFMVPAQRVLTRMMARGMHVDQDEMARQEDLFPKLIREAREKLRVVDPRITSWCQQQQATVPDWELDLESRSQLSTILFDILQCPVKRLTDTGEKAFKDISLESLTREQQVQFAAIDKFTLNALVAEHKELAPLQDYRKLYKAYTAFVRSMRNIKTKGIDKKEREKDPYLQADGRVHASFNQAGTRSGRLACVAGETVLDTSKGPVEIQYLDLDEQTPTYIKTHRGRWRAIKHLIYQGKDTVYSVRTESGETLRCTSEHRLLTPCGWRSVGDLAVGSEVFTQSWRKSGDDSERQVDSDGGVVQSAVHPLGPVGRAVEGDRCRSQGLASLPTCVPGEICGGPWPTVFGATEIKGHRKQKWAQAPECAHPKANAFGVGESRPSESRNGETLRNDRVHCGTQFPAPRAGTAGRSVTQDHRCCESRAHRVGTGVPGIVSSDRTVGHQPPVICEEDARGLLPMLPGGAIFQGTRALEPRVRQDDEPGTPLHLVFAERRGVSGSAGVTGGGHKLREAAGAKGQPGGRLRRCGVESGSGDRRGLPPRRAGRGARLSSQECGLRGAKVHRCGGQERPEQDSSQRFRVSRIVEISPVGFMDVWDVEVEGDHSYAAGGFLNHNCKLPNMQQLPRDSIVKRMYASRFGKQLGAIYQADLSQIELRLLAAACGDPLMVKAYRDKIDLHSLTASKVFNTPYEHFTKGYMADLQKRGHDKLAKELEGKRSIAKTTNFLTGYGGGAFGLQTTLAESGVFLSLEECERIVEALFETYPALKRHIGLYKRFILDHACAVSITGRVRVFEEVFSEDQGFVNKALRSGYNHLIQSTASDIMLTCMAVIEYLMREAGLQSVLVSTVHDSIVVDALRSELPLVHEICDGVVNAIPEIMRQVMGPDYDASWLDIVPLEGDCECGPSYGEQRKIVPDAASGKVDWDALFAEKRAA